jgi:hypothetical protein
MLEASALREILSKNGRARRQARSRRTSAGRQGLSEHRACSFVGADRKMIRYRSSRPPETELRIRRTQIRRIDVRFPAVAQILAQAVERDHYLAMPALSTTIRFRLGQKFSGCVTTLFGTGEINALCSDREHAVFDFYYPAL